MPVERNRYEKLYNWHVFWYCSIIYYIAKGIIHGNIKDMPENKLKILRNLCQTLKIANSRQKINYVQIILELHQNINICAFYLIT